MPKRKTRGLEFCAVSKQEGCGEGVAFVPAWGWLCLVEMGVRFKVPVPKNSCSGIKKNRQRDDLESGHAQVGITWSHSL